MGVLQFTACKCSITLRVIQHIVIFVSIICIVNVFDNFADNLSICAVDWGF